MARRNQVVVLGLVLVAIASVVLLISWSSDDRNIVRELEEEPTLTVYVNETGEIKEMKLEEYLAGVVAGEMFPDWPVEAYAAQAIFARSFTMDFVSQGGVKDKYGADVSTSIEETQAYNPQAVTEEIRRGVEMTRGEVMTYGNRYVRGWFHAYSGGITARAKEGLDYQEEEPPFTKSVRLPDNEHVPEDVKAWQVEYSAAELRNLLAPRGVNVGEITGVEITERGPTERITKILVKGTQGEQEITGPEFRLAVDSTKMKSTLVREFAFENGVLRIAGTGYGHGVGLSQWDAFMLAKEGKSPEEIVQTFFEGVTIRRIYD
ncbi:MAG: SpoIID/LytB domain-containing protein [Limnochordia bacterium]|jgi:stage II sporulation protein D|nr:SpoIID/LytB domain-containing protein [Bacillota bacterium]NLL08990.1 SpoIID/LytB domain-containing protein [Bacillota bacterium]HBG09145.1 stage II sporulation protein SpoIID [Bacillota bacterium]